MRPASLLLVALSALFLAACAHSSPSPLKAVQPSANPCDLVAIYPISFQAQPDGYLATWPSPPIDTSTPGRLNSQTVTTQGRPSLHDLGSQGPLVATHRFSIHYSLHNATGASNACNADGAFWSLDCQDGTSRYADLWAHSDPCVWDEGI